MIIQPNRFTKKLSTVFLASLLPVLSACQTGLPDDANSVSQPVTSEKAQEPGLWPSRELSPPLNNAVEEQVSSILAKMSLAEKVGQIIQPELKTVTPEDVRTYHLGSVLNGGGTSPNNDKYATVEDWASLAQEFYLASMDESDGNVAIPLIWGSDAIHGNNNVFGATLFPHNIGLGAANDPELISRIGAVTAKETVATGIDWTFGPTVAVVRDIRWGRTYESYSENPDIVRSYAREMIKGIQGTDNTAGVYQPERLVATAKHFIGDGGTTNGIDRGDTAVSEQELVDIHAAGYISALDANVMTTMASFNSWNGDKLHGHEYLLTDVLKERMGFNGFVVSDWNGHQHVPGCTVTSCPQAINAGIDMVMTPNDWKELYANTIKDVEEGNITMARLDDAVSRILRVKITAGLFEAGPVVDRPFVGDISLIGSDEHRAVAREAVRKSLVLLKNNNNVLPISSSANILVAGDAADNIGKAAGGWTISWQGTGNTNEDFPGATSILTGIQQAADGNVHYDIDGNWSDSSFSNKAKPDVAIVVYGEEPYAEWHGDLANIEYQYGTKTDLALLKSLKEQGIPVVSVFISGRPLWTNKELNASDAFVAAWLPGSEGAGVADVLLEKKNVADNYDFQGRLSFSWPNSIDQAVLNVGQDDYDPLFAYGYGLTYESSVDVTNSLSESSARKASAELDEAWLFVSRSILPWEFELAEQGVAPIIVTTNTAKSGDDENLSLLSIDKVSQEDARQIIWKGLRPATISLASKFPQDFEAYLAQDAVLELSYKVNEKPSGQVTMTIECETQCNKEFSVTKQLNSAPTGEWQYASIELACLADNESGLSDVTAPFVITSTGALDISVADIKIVAIRDASYDVLTCE